MPATVPTIRSPRSKRRPSRIWRTAARTVSRTAAAPRLPSPSTTTDATPTPGSAYRWHAAAKSASDGTRKSMRVIATTSAAPVAAIPNRPTVSCTSQIRRGLSIAPKAAQTLATLGIDALDLARERHQGRLAEAPDQRPGLDTRPRLDVVLAWHGRPVDVGLTVAPARQHRLAFEVAHHGHHRGVRTRPL